MLRTKFVAFHAEGEKLTLNTHKKRDWVTISVGVILIVCSLAVVLSAIKLGIVLQ